MSAIDWIVVVAFGAIVALASTRLKNIWSGRVAGADQPPGWWPLGSELWRGYVRGMPIGVVGSWALIALVVAASFLSNQEDASSGLAVPSWFAVIAMASVFGFLLLFLSVVFFNRPKFAVPPPRRAEHGAFTAYLRRKRGNDGEHG